MRTREACENKVFGEPRRVSIPDVIDCDVVDATGYRIWLLGELDLNEAL